MSLQIIRYDREFRIFSALYIRILLVVEPSFESLNVAEKIKGVATGMNKAVSVVLNKIESENTAHKSESELRIKYIEVIGTIPNDPLVFEACLEGRALGGFPLLANNHRVINYLRLSVTNHCNL